MGWEKFPLALPGPIVPLKPTVETGWYRRVATPAKVTNPLRVDPLAALTVSLSVAIRQAG